MPLPFGTSESVSSPILVLACLPSGLYISLGDAYFIYHINPFGGDASEVVLHPGLKIWTRVPDPAGGGWTRTRTRVPGPPVETGTRVPGYPGTRIIYTYLLPFLPF